ncbi:MAG: hypothetical protein ACI85Q_002351 [Salibacteraceae bacterium]|jgi:hypothetical protein
MKKLLFVLPVFALLVGCSEAPKSDSNETPTEVVEVAEEAAIYPYFAGEEFDREQALNEQGLDTAILAFDGNPKDLILTTKITAACQQKGCWMTINAGGEEVRVSFKDYDFFVPLDSEGHQATVNGTLFYDTLSVDQLKHFAMDANASEDSIQSITEPVLTLSYEATGVYVD